MSGYDFEYIYCGAPIDVFMGAYTFAEAVAMIATRNPYTPKADIEREVNELTVMFDTAENYVIKAEGPLRLRGNVCYMPCLSEFCDRLRPIIIVKADNNGTTYVFSDFPITDHGSLSADWEIIKKPRSIT